VQIHTVVTGGMPGWQITLISAGAALLAAVLAVLLDRAWATRRHITAPAA
jgi:LPS O-antigen subunit length determinant protein (WzzB/FepE family)